MTIPLNNAYTQWKDSPSDATYEDFGKALLQFVTMYVKRKFILQEEIREEVTTNSIIRVLEELSTYDSDKAPFEAWVILKIGNVKNNILEQINNRRESPLLESDPTPDKFRGIDAKILLKQFTKTLSVDEQSLIQLKLDGLEGEEIAAQLGVSHDVVRKRWERIQKKLRKMGK